MNRAHNVDESLNSVKLAQAIGFENITVDLMYGLPNLSLEDWKKNIQTVIDFKIPHISAYCLTVEERTALDKKVKDGALKPLDEEEQAEQFQQLVSLLKENGYEQYEISNFALPNQYAKHNSAYWKGTSYLGIGPSSHSFDGKVRRFNVANNALYIKGFHDNSIPFEHELLTPENRFNEILMTGLRTKWGVDLAELEKILPLSESFHLDLKSAFDQKWLYRVDQRIFLTEQGKLMADQVASSLFY